MRVNANSSCAGIFSSGPMMSLTLPPREADSPFSEWDIAEHD